MADSGPYWMAFKDPGQTEAVCYDGEVHGPLIVSRYPRRDLLKVVTTVPKPDDVPDGMRIARHFKVNGQILEREYFLEPVDNDSASGGGDV